MIFWYEEKGVRPFIAAICSGVPSLLSAILDQHNFQSGEPLLYDHSMQPHVVALHMY